MHKECREWIVGILKNHMPLLALAAKYRSKFEGWLQFEFASFLEKKITKVVRVESSCGTKGGFSDILFELDNTTYYVELKTPNTNYRMPGVENKSRPITRNIYSIINDAIKLKKAFVKGIIAFVLFPIPLDNDKWLKYLHRISIAVNFDLNKDYYTILEVPLDNRYKCKFVICCFPIP